MSTVVLPRNTTITEEHRAKLKEVHDKAFEQGYLILDEQWMKNPLLPHFFAPVLYRDFLKKSHAVGVIRVDLKYGKPSATVMMPTEDCIDLL